MALKRKRSDSELSFASSSAFSSPPRPGSSSFDFCAMATNMEARPSPFSPIRSGMPSHVSGRTMKRFRDNRPSEEEVHQHTLSILYSAQHLSHNPQQQRSLDTTMTAPTSTHTNNQPARQLSLHSFWNLPKPAPASNLSPSSSAASQPVRYTTAAATDCEDCGARLGTGDGHDDNDAMEVDGFGVGGEDCACGACGKVVCFGCSVSNLGEQRRCLVCAGRKVWVGGIGWTSRTGVEVC